MGACTIALSCGSLSVMFRHRLPSLFQKDPGDMSAAVDSSVHPQAQAGHPASFVVRANLARRPVVLQYYLVIHIVRCTAILVERVYQQTNNFETTAVHQVLHNASIQRRLVENGGLCCTWK